MANLDDVHPSQFVFAIIDDFVNSSVTVGTKPLVVLYCDWWWGPTYANIYNIQYMHNPALSLPFSLIIPTVILNATTTVLT